MSDRSMLAGIFLWASASIAGAQQAAEPSRGELLYSMHCVECHTTQIHWRDKKRATDWISLRDEVRRWQGVLGLQWRDDEVEDVARFLNTQHYHYPLPRSRSTGSTVSSAGE